MFVNYQDLNFCVLIFLLSFVSSTALFCSNLTAIGDKETACFLESSRSNPVVLHSSGHSLVLPCHVARSKHATVEWWYTDAQNLINIKIYPVFPPVRPTVLRFITSLSSQSKDSNETDILDASILLRHVNVDDSGLYRCVIRPWAMDPLEQMEESLANDDSDVISLKYDVRLTGPRLCQSNPITLPCFNAMRTSSPTVIDAYQTAFLQCVVKNYDRPISVFWVVGNSAVNSVLITDYLTSNQHRGDRIRRVFPLSPFDYSIELSVNRTVSERVFSCVIEGSTEPETTLFTYIVRTIDLLEHKHQTHNTSGTVEKISAHDTLNYEQLHSSRESQQVSSNEENVSEEHTHTTERNEETEGGEEQSEETSTTV